MVLLVVCLAQLVSELLAFNPASQGLETAPTAVLLAS